MEATAHDTEARLLNGLRKCAGRGSPDSADLDLKETLAALRRGRGLAAGQKLLLVLDQFEQYLHAQPTDGGAELVQALRQCDGCHVQALLLVRDDFWLAVSRFLAELEVELLQGHNVALVDLFDPRHARKVLLAFGRAFAALPDDARSLSREQETFLDQALAGLAQQGKIISVRLALFAEMIKGKPWTPPTLKSVGGMEGVGVTFLEETFTAATAPPQHRVHQRAAQAVLKALLPESGTAIKGNMRAYADLLAASGYTARPRDFDALLRILDGDVRLLTPTEAETGEQADETRTPEERSVPSTQYSVLSTGSADAPRTRYYQLTHDYLVPALPALERQRERSVALLGAELARRVPPEGDDAAKETLAKRQANAAVALVRLGQAEAVWPLLRHRPDPRLRSYLIHRLAPLRADPHVLLHRFAAETDTSARRGRQKGTAQIRLLRAPVLLTAFLCV